MNQAFVQGVFGSIAKISRELLDRHAGKSNINKLVSLCEDLLSEKGEASGIALAWNVLKTYQSLNDIEKLKFFEFMESRMSPDPQQIQRVLDEYKAAPTSVKFEELIHVCEPKRLELIRRMNMSPDGIQAVVAMRRDLLSLLKQHKHLKIVDNDFRGLFASWFNRGFLNLVRIDWKTPAHKLEKLIAYETVHEIKNWEDLRRRLDRDRRCYAFYHPALGDDKPLIFIEIALLDHLADNVQVLLNLDETVGDPRRANTAIFYSINNCQPGLKGISLGNFLIKQVAADLQTELPNIKTFSTLSPIPGFMIWVKKINKLEVHPMASSAEQVCNYFDQKASDFNESDMAALEMPLKKLCAHYLTQAKSKYDQVLNPVARFHLGNGARLERINWLGDKSKKGMRESAGLMVNYLYDLKHIESNHERFVKQNEITLSAGVKALLK